MLDAQTEKNKRDNERREGYGMTVSVSHGQCWRKGHWEKDVE